MSAQASPDPAMLSRAHAVRARGWRPIPLDHPHAHGEARNEQGEPTGCTGAHDYIPCDGERGKHPCGHWGRQSSAVPTDGMLSIWFGNDPRNIGIACGPSGLVVLDEDEDGALSRLAAELGQELPRTYRVRTRRGWHWYFTPPHGRVVGNAAGRLADHHIDVRGGAGRGGYVVGAGSVHASGHVYAAEDDGAAAVEIPGWVLGLIDTAREGGPLEGWSDDLRYGEEGELREQFARRVEEITHRGNPFREELFRAARDGWRLVNCDVLSEHEMLAQLRDAVIRVWGAPPDLRDRRIVYDEAKAAAEQSPWAVVAKPQEIGDHTDFTTPDPVTADDELLERAAKDGDEDAAAEIAYRRLRARRAAERRLAAEERRPITRMTAAEFLAAPQPTYLVPGLLYQDSLAVVFGPPGAAKTFFVLDLALHLATGKLWRGETLLPRTRVHYLMAEGQAVNVGRTLAWLTHHKVEPDELEGWFDAFPEPVALTPEGVGDYLAEIERDRPGLIVLDTKHAMMEGDESKAADVKVMRDALTLIRRATGACVLLVDHTGLGDQDRARGSNSQKAMVATEIKLSVDGGIRTAEITRNTAGSVTGSWSFQLERVPDAPHPPGTDIPVVPVPTARGASKGLELRSSCWSIPRATLPPVVAQIGGAEGEAACDVFRALVEAQDQDGLTVAQIRGLLGESPREHKRTVLYGAVNQLEKAGVLEHPTAGTKSWILALPYTEWRPSEVQELGQGPDQGPNEAE